jgi:hypothetical protein
VGGGVVVCVVNLERVGGVFLYEVNEHIFWILDGHCVCWQSFWGCAFEVWVSVRENS